MPKFSIITTVYLDTPERVEQFLTCIESVKNQTFKDFEWVVIDDGSPLSFLWGKLWDVPNVNLIHKLNENRIIAYNTAFEVAKGDWWTFLDSDDELDPDCLNILSQEIKINKRFKMFNFGCIYKHKDGTVTKREPFKPKMLKEGHEVFGGGNIVNGTFIFHKSVYERLGGYPPDKIENIDCSEINYGSIQPRNLYMTTPYDFSAAAQMEFPELRQFYMVNFEDEPDKIIKELGNPWGNDIYLFFKYTREYYSKPLDEYLYIVYPKS